MTPETLAAYFERRYLAERDLSPGTVDAYRLALRKLRPPADTIATTDDQLTAHLRTLDHLAPATVNSHAATVAAVLNMAREDQDRRPVKYRRRREYLDPPEAWTIAELSAILDQAARQAGHIGPHPAAVWWPALILTAYDTAARIRALMATEAGDLAPDCARLTLRAVNQKNRRGKRPQLHPDTAAALRKIRPHDGRRLLFGDWPHDRQRAHPERFNGRWQTLRRHLRAILTAAGLPAGRRHLWHKVRRTLATQLTIEAGQAAAVEYLQHSSARVTERYIDPDQIKDTAAALAVARPTLRPPLAIAAG